MLKAKLGIAPIAWWNDDLPELSDDVSLDECLRQASVAGFTGMETGRRFPMNMKELGPILEQYGMSVCGVRREKAALSSGCKPHPANAPAGSNRSSHGGDEMAEAFGIARHV